ncbi:uncharacterized protein LOC132202282 isoform X2 [Neocloeon triangulifer]|uniref:uncharacterized protein LOC132202282 isoform X2 n=1 Tax=Neocloeon triangulifer TaxID=2078957 RepID=UPI00286F031F|nr:uncharacterized protein LOC132202282 isoform X2 [Neocloeon triangulifer]
MAPAMKLTTSLFPFSDYLKLNSKFLRIGPPLMNAILASLFLILISKNAYAQDSDNAPELCIVRALDNRHVSPWLSQPRRTPGCSSHGQLGADGTEVHVIRALLDKGSQLLRPPMAAGLMPIDLLLDSTDHNSSTNPIALILSSDRPVLWRISGQGLPSGRSHSVVVCKECRVESGISLQVEGKDWQSKKALVRYTKKNWGAITSFTEVRGANKLELMIGFGVPGERSSECDTNSNQMSPVASATAIVPQQALGCFNGDLVGTSYGDVYVVEIVHQEMIRHQEIMPPVKVSLLGESKRPVLRNITLFLKAHRPTKWQLISHGIDGKIIVISDQQVENSDMEENQSIEVRNKELPDRMDDLLLSAINYGPLVLYARTERASGFEVIVANTKDADEQLSGDMAGEDKITDASSMVNPQQVTMQHNVLRSTVVSSLKSDEQHHQLIDDLRREITVSCEPKRMNISFPKTLMSKLGVRSIALNNPSCRSQSNDTHIWLSTHITSCNTLSSSENDKTVYSNAVHFKFGMDEVLDTESDDEDQEDDDKKLRVVCKYISKFPGQISVIYGGIDTDDEPSERLDGPSRSSNGHNLYMMELYKDRNHSDLLSFDFGPSLVTYDDKIFVRTWIESGLPIQVVPEKCWISNSSDYRATRSGTIYLVKKACAADLSVDVEDHFSERSKHRHGGFNFQVNRAYSEMNLLYLHCALGLCTHKPEHARGNLLICANQALNCFKGGMDYFSSTAQQIITRGPIKLVPRKAKPMQPHGMAPTGMPPVDPVGLPVSPYNGLATKTPTVQHTPVPETRTTSVNPGNISTEMAAVIALIAFLIGVVVTGAMWFIHVKTDPYRNGRKGHQQPAIQTASQQQRSSPALGMNGQQASSAAI